MWTYPLQRPALTGLDRTLRTPTTAESPSRRASPTTADEPSTSIYTTQRPLYTKGVLIRTSMVAGR